MHLCIVVVCTVLQGNVESCWGFSTFYYNLDIWHLHPEIKRQRLRNFPQLDRGHGIDYCESGSFEWAVSGQVTWSNSRKSMDVMGYCLKGSMFLVPQEHQ